MKNDPIETALARLDEAVPHTAEGRKQIAKALDSKWNLVAAKAARIAGESQWIELSPELARALDRLMTGGTAADKGCAAKIAIARALVKLEYDDAPLYLRGMKHIQMEPVWGGSEDRAADLRAACAIGLAGSAYALKLQALVPLLVDPEWVVRAAAARAIAAAGSDAAFLLLKLKSLVGDGVIDVLADCYSGLITLDFDEALPFLSHIAESSLDESGEAAILALGASRRPEAIQVLEDLFQHPQQAARQECILLALATSRTPAAIDFLLGLVREGSETAARRALSALAVCHPVNSDNVRLRDSIRQAVECRSDAAITEVWEKTAGS